MNDLNQQPKIFTTGTTHPPNNNNTANESIDFTLLRLDSFNSTITNNHHHTPCTSCGYPGSSSSNNKRSSPDQHSQDQLISKKPKKLFLDPKETTHEPSPHGFSKIALPSTPSPRTTTTTTQSPGFRRCGSDSSSPPLTKLVPQSPPENSNMARSDAETTPASKGDASLPPRPPLRRSISGLSPEKRYSPSSSANDISEDESSSYKRLRKMKDSMKEINQMWDEMMPDELEDDKGTEENTDANANKVDSGTNCEEAVCVERTGDCITVHFRCPCGKGYQIILSGRDCYYKLM